MTSINPHREPPPPGSAYERSAYHIPAAMALSVLASAALGRRRDMPADAAACLAPPCPPPQQAGGENIPTSGPFLLVMNHYTRPGLDAWWPAILATWAVGQARPNMPLRWLMTSEWAWPSWGYRLLITPITRLAFAGLARAYGLLLTPPVMNSNYGPQEGARAVLRFLAAAREAASRGHALAIAPEGRDGPMGALASLPPGAGRFLILLAKSGLPILPAGVCEEPPGRLLVRFGAAGLLRPPAGVRRAEADDWAATAVMGRVASLLPPGLRGPYEPRESSAPAG